MSAPLAMLCAWLLFGGTHLVLGMPPLRTRLAARFGEQAFVAMFSALAALGLAVLAVVTAVVGGDGPAGLALGRWPLVRMLLASLAFAGVVLAVAGLMNYPRSPMALFRTKLHPPSGIERISRHAFFVGLAVFATAHALLAATLAMAVHFLGFAALALVGAILQDRKLLAKHGEAYASYLQATSLVPFVALLRGRQSLRVEERLPVRLALCGFIALALLAAHPLWSAFHGAPFAGLMALGGLFATARRWRHAKAAGQRS